MRINKRRRFVSSNGAFSLVEVLLSTTVLAILMVLVANVISSSQKAWSRTSGNVSQFREARRAFDTIKRYVSQATLNTYMRYSYDNGTASPFSSGGAESKNAAPTKYASFSELQFVCGPASNVIPGASDTDTPGHAIFFQAPIGWSPKYPNMPTLLNGRGFFVRFGDDLAIRPDFLAQRLPPVYRYRLMEYAPSAESNLIYDQTTAGTQSDWYTDIAVSSRPLATNVLALIFSPRRPTPASGSTSQIRDIAPAYLYDSSNADGKAPYELPPVVDIVMVVLDERSAQRLADTASSGSSPPITISGFTDATGTNMQDDLKALEADLNKKKVNYRVFNASVPLRNSKWATQ